MKGKDTFLFLCAHAFEMFQVSYFCENVSFGTQR